jgi:hypothetical protein
MHPAEHHTQYEAMLPAPDCVDIDVHNGLSILPMWDNVSIGATKGLVEGTPVLSTPALPQARPFRLRPPGTGIPEW